MAYDLWLGRIHLLTIDGSLGETFASATTVVGSSVVPGERAPAAYSSLSIPVYGDYTAVDPYAAGQRLRRQVRSLVNNHLMRTQGVYLRFIKDEEINAWLAFGSGSLTYLEGGVSLADYRLEFGDAFVLGATRSSRQGIRCETRDRQLSTTPRDYLKTYYAAGGGGYSAVHYLPIGASDPAGKFSGAASIGTVGSINGSIPYTSGRQHGDTLSFELSDTDRNKADVVCLDRRGFTAPSYSQAGDQDPQTTYGWEEIYGSQYKVSAGEVPVMQNARCRVLYSSGSSFTVQTSSGGAYASDGTLSCGFSTLQGANVVEWTPYRAVVHASFTGGPGRGDVYMTLQRGWAGPRVDVYPQNSSGTPASTSLSYSGGLTQVAESSPRWQMLSLGRSSAEVNSDSVGVDTIILR